MKDILLPPWDTALAALIEDLHLRGLLDETLFFHNVLDCLSFRHFMHTAANGTNENSNSSG